MYNGTAVRWRRESPGTVVCVRDAFYNVSHLARHLSPRPYLSTRSFRSAVSRTRPLKELSTSSAKTWKHWHSSFHKFRFRWRTRTD